MASLLLTTVCLQLLLAVLGNGLPTKTCSKYGCPEYTVIKKTAEFEVRRYPSYSYAVAGEQGSGMFWADNRNFMKLFRYISGKNEEKKKIPMTVPVMCPIEKDEQGGYVKDFRMMFWLPKEYQCIHCAPKPVKADNPEEQVVIVTQGERIAYVRSYGWWALEPLIRRHETKLRASLDAAGVVAGVDYDEHVVISAVYDGPWKVFGRHNEVMFMKEV